jgi:flagellar motor protein MotB
MGYVNFSMSVNAQNAYNDGKKPLSKWTKKTILEEIENNLPKIYDEKKLQELKEMTKEKLIQDFLCCTEWHHTSKFYNETNFYCIDFDLISDFLKTEEQKQKEQQERVEKKRKQEEEEEQELILFKQKNKKLLDLTEVKESTRIIIFDNKFYNAVITEVNDKNFEIIILENEEIYARRIFTKLALGIEDNPIKFYKEI